MPKADQQTVRHVPANTAPRVATTAANSVFDAGKKAKRPRKPRELFDFSTVQVRRDVPIPTPRTGAGTPSVYEDLFKRLRVGDMVELPDRQAHTFMSWAKKNAPGALTRRALGDGRTGVWRVEPPKG